MNDFYVEHCLICNNHLRGALSHIIPSSTSFEKSIVSIYGKFAHLPFPIYAYIYVNFRINFEYNCNRREL